MDTMQCTREVRLANKLGLHFRPASLLVNAANRFKADVFLKRGDREVNAKSILEVLLLAAEPGTELSLRAVGEDGGAALDALEALFTGKFGEE